VSKISQNEHLAATIKAKRKLQDLESNYQYQKSAKTSRKKQKLNHCPIGEDCTLANRNA
jgi:hypothetical protein